MAPALNRERSLERFRDQEFDLAVVGGGINGAAIARDAAMRGLKVALVERGDFAGATSSRSSKLIHGGFRYLPQGQFRLVYHALRERERLRRHTAPHLVKPIRFLFPVYRGRGFGRFTMAMGLFLYDFFARTPRGEGHESLSAARVREYEPTLSRSGLKGGALYYDAWAEDSRITFENILDAGLHGAAIANYAAIEGLTKRDGFLVSASVLDLRGGATCELRARHFVNAAGPWVDHIRRMDDPAANPSIRTTKGVHLVFQRAMIPVRESLVLGDANGRIVFVMPHDRYVLVGTTDTDYSGDPAEVATEPDDITYLLSVLGESLPGIKLTPDDVVASFAGLRALVVSGGNGAPSSVPREEEILRSAAGLISVAGGKLTTHREIAEKVVNVVLREIGEPIKPSPTRNTPLPGARKLDRSETGDALTRLPRDAREILNARYGTRAQIVAASAGGNAELSRPLSSGCPAIGAEVVSGVRNEMVLSLADFLVRRTSLSWRAPLEAEAAAPAVARILASELGWDRAREQAELAEFNRIYGRGRVAAAT